MGVYMETETELAIPDDVRAARMLSEFLTSPECQRYGWAREWREDEIAQDYVIEMLLTALGEDDTTEVEPPVRLNGFIVRTFTSGKTSTLTNGVLKVLAAAGATGTVDWECEGEMGRDRLKDGKVTTYEAVVTYPGDEEE